MNCSKCGAVNSIDAKFCSSCGFNLSEQPQQNENNQTGEALGLNQAKVTQQSQPETIVQQASDFNVQPTSVTLQQVSTPQNPNINNKPISNLPDNKKSNKKGLIAIAITVIAIVAGVFIFTKPFASDEKLEQQKIDNMFNPNKLIPVKDDDEYGYINPNGKLVIKPNYDSVSEFHGDYAIVRTESEIDDIETTIYQVIDKKGNVKHQSEYEIEYLEKYQLWIIDERLYNSSMKEISTDDVRVEYEESGYFVWVNSKKNTGGIMNEKGKQTYTYEFQEDESYISIEPSSVDESLDETYCRINIENEKYAIVNCDTGVVVHDFSDKYVSPSNDNIFEILDHDTFEQISTIYIQDNKILYKTERKDIRLYYNPGYIEISDNSKSYNERYTYLHTKTGEIKSEPPEETDDYSDTKDLDEWEILTENKKISCNQGYGLMKNDKVVLPCEWDNLKYLELDLYKFLKDNGKEYIYGYKDSKCYLIDLRTKKTIAEFNSTNIAMSYNTPFIYYTDSETKDKKIYNLLSKKSLHVDPTSTIVADSNYITVRNSKNKLYYNNDLKLIYTEDLEKD